MSDHIGNAVKRCEEILLGLQGLSKHQQELISEALDALGKVKNIGVAEHGWENVPIECFIGHPPNTQISEELASKISAFVTPLFPYVNFNAILARLRRPTISMDTESLSWIVTCDDSILYPFEFSEYIKMCGPHFNVDTEEYEHMYKWYMNDSITASRYYQYQKKVIAQHFCSALVRSGIR